MSSFPAGIPDFSVSKFNCPTLLHGTISTDPPQSQDLKDNSAISLNNIYFFFDVLSESIMGMRGRQNNQSRGLLSGIMRLAE